MRRVLAVATVLVLAGAACSGDSTDDDESSSATVPDHSAEAAAIADAPDDRSLPPDGPEAPTGSYGFSRYVFNDVDGDVLATLIEGPRGQQIRCQDAELDCSFEELKALYDSGDPVPDYLGMDRDELGELVDQLSETRDAVNEHETIEEACAAGFRVSSSQNANMGIHVINPNGQSAEFDPGPPADGAVRQGRRRGADPGGTGHLRRRRVDRRARLPLGRCAVFTLPMTEEHPDAFAGPIDNWHIHLNTCAGNPEEGGVEEGDEVFDTESAQATFSREQCEQQGGRFMDIIPTWMMHAYVDENHDAQGGVFAMFNPSIWPIVDDPSTLTEDRTVDVENGTHAPINNFDFGAIEVDTGEDVVFSNSDGVPHTVTARGRPRHRATPSTRGSFGAGQVYTQSFDEAGEYDIFCTLHPQMTGTVVVND